MSVLHYAGQPRITLECAPELKLRLLMRLSNWATDKTGNLDPGVEIRTGALRDRHFDDGPETVRTVFDLAFGLFAKYGDPPFTADRGKVIFWWEAPAIHTIYPVDLERLGGVKDERRGVGLRR